MLLNEIQETREGKKVFVNSLIVSFFLFYAYNTTFQSYLYGSRMVGVILIMVAVLCGLINCIFVCKMPHFFVRDFSVFWFVLAFFSIFNNQDLINSSESRWILPMAGMVSVFFLGKDTSWLNTFVKVAKIFIFLHAFFTIFFYIFDDLYLNYFINLIPGDRNYLIAKYNEGCMPGITGHYSTNGIYLGFGLVFFIADLFVKVGKKEQCKSAVQIIFVLVALVLTAKRAHILFGVISAYVMFFVYNSNKKATRWIYIFCSIVLIGVLVLVLAQFVPAVENMLNRFLYADGGEITNGRIWFWEYALELFKRSPLVGVGWGGFKHNYYDVIGIYSSTSAWVDCHSVYLQVLCEQGIIGTLLFCLAVLGTFIQCWRLVKKIRNGFFVVSTEKLYILILSLGLQVFFVLYCFTGNCLYDCEAMYIYILSCSAFYAINYDVMYR